MDRDLERGAWILFFFILGFLVFTYHFGFVLALIITMIAGGSIIAFFKFLNTIDGDLETVGRALNKISNWYTTLTLVGRVIIWTSVCFLVIFMATIADNILIRGKVW